MVIPAKTGIFDCKNIEIPVFAGMTLGLFLCSYFVLHYPISIPEDIFVHITLVIAGSLKR